MPTRGKIPNPCAFPSTIASLARAGCPTPPEPELVKNEAPQCRRPYRACEGFRRAALANTTHDKGWVSTFALCLLSLGHRR